jgi:regulation of enolase protein 1 (concanavalin A-like superfamily)
VIQSVNDADFEVEVKFDAPMPSTQGAGILVQADLANYLRFDFYSDGTNSRAFVGVISNNTGTAQSSVIVGPAGAAPLYMRLKRERNVWTQWYSDNGSTWTEAFSFTYAMQMTAIGLHALNYGGSPPAFTALFDYFRNTQTPRVRVATRLLLQGPYDAGTGLMANTLRSSGALAARYPSRVIPAGAVDSINIEIRNTITAGGSSTRKFAPAWLLRDGSIRDMTDTTKTFVEFDTTDATFYIVVRHANHLPVMSAEEQALSASSVTQYDFSLALTQAYGAEAMEQVTVAGPPRYALIAGNAASGDARVNAADRQVVKSQTGLTGYRIGDLTLNGIVDAQDQTLARANTGRETDIP